MGGLFVWLGVRPEDDARMDEPGQPTVPELPGKFTRFQALCVDIIVAVGVVWVASLCLARWAVSGPVGFVVLATALSALQATAILRQGATLGQGLLSLRLVDFATGGPVSRQAAWHWSAMRAIACMGLLGDHLALVFLGALLCIPILTDRHQRSLYDDWAGVRVIRG